MKSPTHAPVRNTETILFQMAMRKLLTPEYLKDAISERGNWGHDKYLRNTCGRTENYPEYHFGSDTDAGKAKSWWKQFTSTSFWDSGAVGEGFGERLGASLGYGTSSNLCRRITQLQISVQDLHTVSLEGINKVGTGLWDASRGLDWLTAGVWGAVFSAQRAAACLTALFSLSLLMSTVLPHCCSWFMRESTPCSTSGVQDSLWYALGSFQRATEQILTLVTAVTVFNTMTLWTSPCFMLFPLTDCYYNSHWNPGSRNCP